MPVDTSIYGMLQTPQQLQGQMYRNQLLQYQQQQAMQQMQSQNALRQLAQNPDFNPTQIGPDQLRQLWAINPQAAMAFTQQQGQRQLQQSEMMRNIAESRKADAQAVQGQIGQFQTQLLPIKQAALLKYQDILKTTGNPQLALQSAQQVYTTGIDQLPNGLYSPDLLNSAKSWQFNPDMVRAQIYGKEINSAAIKGGPPTIRNTFVGPNQEQQQQWDPETQSWKPMGPAVPRFKPRDVINVGGAYTNVQPDGKGGYIGLNRRTGIMQKIPMAPGVAENTGGGLTGDALDVAAYQYLQTRTLPPLGMGKAGVIVRESIIKRAAELGKSMGMNPQQMAVGQNVGKSTTSAYTQASKLYNLTTGFEATAKGSAGIIQNLIHEGATAKSGVPVLNAWINSGRRNVTGDPMISKLDSAITTFVNEYAKVMSGATGAAGISDAARNEAKKLINDAQTPEQMQATLQQMQQEMSIRSDALKAVLGNMQSQIGGQGFDAKPRTAPTKKAQPSQGGMPVFSNMKQLQDAIKAGKIRAGQKFTDPSGAVHVVN